MIKIRRSQLEDTEAIWQIIKETIATGDTYVFDPKTAKEKMLEYWFSNDKKTYTVLLDDQVAGTFFLKENQPGLGSHIANAAYMTAPSSRGKGIGTAMATFSLEEARKLGFTAMQFNIVVKSNETAIRLWTKMGFKIVGEIPAAFNHSRNGLTNAYIMHRKL